MGGEPGDDVPVRRRGPSEREIIDRQDEVGSGAKVKRPTGAEERVARGIKKTTTGETQSAETRLIGPSSSGMRRHRMAQRSVDLTLAVDKWVVGRDVAGVGWLGSGARCAFPLLLLSSPRKMSNGNCKGCPKEN